MLKFVATSVLGCCGLLCSANTAMACGGGCCSQAVSGCSMNMNMDMGAPMKDMPGMPGMPAPPQASVGSQYRTYSYYPAPTYSGSYGRSSGGGFNDAGFKTRGGR